MGKKSENKEVEGVDLRREFQGANNKLERRVKSRVQNKTEVD